MMGVTVSPAKGWQRCTGCGAINAAVTVDLGPGGIGARLSLCSVCLLVLVTESRRAEEAE